MKKLLILLAATLILTSCGNQSTTQSKTGAEANGEETQQKDRIGERGMSEDSFETGDEEVLKDLLPEEECDFGHFQWGMILDDVVNVHGGGYSHLNENTIRYERVRIEGFPSDAEFTFTDGKLSGATYFIMPDKEYEDKTEYIKDYRELTEKYTKRYGKPVTEEIQFANGMDTDDVAEQGKLLDQGNILFRTVWTSDTTEVRAVMARKDGLCIGVKISPLN